MASITINEIQFSPGTTHTFDSDSTYTILNYTAGTWNGTDATNRVSLKSSTPGVRTYISIPTSFNVTWMSFNDIAIIGGTVTADNSCIGRTANNSGIIWDAGVENIWSADTTASWSNDASWSLGHTPTVNEVAVLNGTSLQPFVADIDVTCGAILIDGSYTTNWSFAGRSLYLIDGFSTYGPGTGNLGNRLNITGDAAAVTFGSTIGVLTAQNCVVDWSGKGIWTNNIGRTFKSLYVAPNKSMIMNGTGSQIFADSSTLCYLGNDSTLTISQLTSFNPYTSVKVFDFGSNYTLNGNGGYYIAGSTASLTFTVPAINYTGTGTFTINPPSTCITDFSSTVSLTGGLTLNQGTVRLRAALTIGGNASTVTFASAIVLDASNCDVTWGSNNGFWTNNENNSIFKSFTLNSDTTCTMNGTSTGQNFITSGYPLTIGSRSKLTSNLTTYLVKDLTSGPLYSLGTGYTWNGTGQTTLRTKTPSTTISISDATYTGSGVWQISGHSTNTPATFNLTGPLSLTAPIFELAASQTNSHITVNTNNYSISCLNMRIGSSVNADMTFNVGSSTVSCALFDASIFDHSAARSLIDLGSSQWTLAGNWSCGLTKTILPGTSTFRITNSATITSSGRAFNNLWINATGFTVLTADTLNIANGGSLRVDSPLGLSPIVSTPVLNWLGTYSFYGANNVTINSNASNITLTVPPIIYTGTGLFTVNDATTRNNTVSLTGPLVWSGSVNLTAASQLNLFSSISMTGARSVLTVSGGGAIPTLAASACDLYFSGTDQTISDARGTMFKSLTLSPSTKVTMVANSSGTGFQGNTTLLTLGNDATLTTGASNNFHLRATADMNIFSLGSRAAILGTGPLTMGAYTYANVNIPALTYTGPVTIRNYNTSISPAPIYNLIGGMNLGTSNLTISPVVSGDCVFNTNNVNITCGRMAPGNDGTGVFTANFGSSLITCTSYDPVGAGMVGTGDATLNFSTSTWNCSGNWRWAPNTVQGAFTSQVNILGTSSITSNNRYFYRLATNAGVSVVTTLDTLNILSGGILSSISPLTFSPTASVPVVNFAGSYTWNGGGAVGVGGATNSLSLSFPAINYAGSGLLSIGPASTSSTTLTGDFTWGGAGGFSVTKGLFYDGTRGVSIAGPITLNMDGTFSAAGVWTQTGNANVTFTAVPAWSTANWALALQGTGTLANNAAPSSIGLRSIACGFAADRTTTISGTQFILTDSSPLIIGPGTLVQNATLTCKLTQDGPPVILSAGYRWSGAAIAVLTNGVSGVVQTLPAITRTGTGGLTIGSANTNMAGTYNLGGAINLPGATAEFRLYSSGGGTASTIFNTNNYDVSCAYILKVGTVGSGVNSFNFGSSRISVGHLDTSAYNLYSSDINFQSSDWTCSGNFSLDGTHNYSSLPGSLLRMTGANRSLIVLPGPGTGDCTNMDIIFNSIPGMRIINNKGFSFKSLILESGADVTSSGPSLTSFIGGSSIPLTFKSGGKLLISGQTFFQRTSSTGPFYDITGAPVITLNNAAYFSCVGVDTTAIVPGYTFLGSGQFIMEFTSHTPSLNFQKKIQLGGNLYHSGQIDIRSQGMKGTFDSLNNRIVATGHLNLGGTGIGSDLTANFGSSIVDVTGSVNNTTYNSGQTFVNLSTSTWNVGANWSNFVTHTINPGTSIVNFFSTAASAVLSAGKLFYDVNVNNASKVFSFTDPASVHNLITTAMTSYSQNGTTLTASGNVNYNGTGTLNLGTGLTLTGPSTTLAINSTVGAVTSISCALSFNGTNQLFTDSKTVTFKSLTIGNNNYLSMTGPSITTFTGNGPVINFGSGVTLYRTVRTDFYVTNSVSDSTIYAFTSGTDASFGGTGQLNFFMNPSTNNGRVIIPDITGTGITSLWIMNNGSAFPRLGWTVNSINIAGTTTTGLRLLSQAAGNKTEIFNILGPITTQGTMQIGSTVDGTGIWYWGNSAVSVKAVDGTTYNASINQFHNFQNSNFTVSGGWSDGSNAKISHQLDTATFTGTGNITSNGKAFNYVTINAPGNTVTLSDNFVAHGYKRVAGTFNQNGKKFTVQGDFQNIIDCD